MLTSAQMITCTSLVAVFLSFLTFVDAVLTRVEMGSECVRSRSFECFLYRCKGVLTRRQASAAEARGLAIEKELPKCRAPPNFRSDQFV